MIPTVLVSAAGWRIEPPVSVPVAAGTSPPPIPSGSLLADRIATDGSEISVAWDDQCAPANANILYGPLDQVSTYTVSGSVCGILNPEAWTAVPAGDLWFVVVGDDGLVPLMGTSLRIVVPSSTGETGIVGWALSDQDKEEEFEAGEEIRRSVDFHLWNILIKYVSPVAVLMSWCRLITLTSVALTTIASRTSLAASINWVRTRGDRSSPTSRRNGPRSK